jgi:hypothetical protein
MPYDISYNLSFLKLPDQGTEFEFTVAQMPDQGTTDKVGVILCRAPFLVLFWRGKKVQKKAPLPGGFKAYL